MALEFGYIGEKDHFEHEAIQLIAYNGAGDRIVIEDAAGNRSLLASDAKAITQPQIRANSAFVIGVRHREGEIASVELRFGGLDDGSATQFVYRIWHEALPPAAVLQGTIVTEGGRGSFAENTGEFWQLPEPVDENGITIPFRTERARTVRMPFRCNRGVVMLRGFKLQTIDQSPREVQRIAVEVNPRHTGRGASLSQTPGVFRGERGGSVVLQPSGALITRERGSFGYRVHVYFTLVCWDSDQVDLTVSQGQQMMTPLQQDSAMGGAPVVTTDPCSDIARENRGDAGQVCGPLFGALQAFEFRMPEDQEVEELSLEIGSVACHGPLS